MKDFPKQAYHALQSIVGPEYVSDDPVICETYTWGGEFVDTLYEKGTTKKSVVDQIVVEFEAGADRVERDADVFVSELLEKQMLVPVSAES